VDCPSVLLIQALPKFIASCFQEFCVRRENSLKIATIPLLHVSLSHVKSSICTQALPTDSTPLIITGFLTNFAQTNFSLNCHSIGTCDHHLRTILLVFGEKKFVLIYFRWCVKEFEGFFFVTRSNTDQVEKIEHNILKDNSERKPISHEQVRTYVDFNQKRIKIFIKKHVKAEKFEMIVF
jgi:hypothetical protein